MRHRQNKANSQFRLEYYTGRNALICELSHQAGSPLSRPSASLSICSRLLISPRSTALQIVSITGESRFSNCSCIKITWKVC